MQIKTTSNVFLMRKLCDLQQSCKDLKLELEQIKFYYQKIIIQMTKGFRILIKRSSIQSLKSVQKKTNNKGNYKTKNKVQDLILTQDLDKQNQQERSNANSCQIVNKPQKYKISSGNSSQRQQQLNLISKRYKHKSRTENEPLIYKSKSLHSITSYNQIQSIDIKKLRQKMQQQLIQLKVLQNREIVLDKSTQRMQNYLTQQRLKINSYKSNQSLNNESLKNSKGKSELSLTQFNIQQNEKILDQIEINSLNPTFRQTCKSIIQQNTFNSIYKKLFCPMKHIYYTGDINQNQKFPHGEGKYHKCCNKAPTMLNISSEILFYQGQFKHGKFHGQGTITYIGGVKFIGEFQNGKRHGKGCLYLNGKCEIGIWKNELLTGLY